MHRIYSLLIVLILLTAAVGNVHAAGLDRPAAGTGPYYVSPTGSDSNAGTSSGAPFKTLTKAVSMLSAGARLNILPGVYNDRLLIKQSGTASAPITVNGAAGAIIDMRGGPDAGIDLKGSYINVSLLEVRNVGGICVNLAASNLSASRLTVHDCLTHGIHVSAGAHVKVLSSNIYRAVLENASRSMPSGWASAIKVRESDDVLIEGNTVHENYGEGMGTRGTNITIRNNKVYDNFSVNIYTNSENVTIERNLVYCTTNSAFYRNGTPAGGIDMAEEYFTGWGARMKNPRILNNIVAYCKNGVRYDGADPSLTGGGLKSATIMNNTLYGTVEAALGIVYGPAQSGNLIANNIIWQANNRLAYIQNGTGLTFQNNLWKAAPAAIAQGLGDRTGDPGFAVSTPGYAAADYKLKSGSLAIGGAANLGLATDYFAAPRSLPYDMGALEGG
jgi:parallel beta-helix repeat protein